MSLSPIGIISAVPINTTRDDNNQLMTTTTNYSSLSSNPPTYYLPTSKSVLDSKGAVLETTYGRNSTNPALLSSVTNKEDGNFIGAQRFTYFGKKVASIEQANSAVESGLIIPTLQEDHRLYLWQRKSARRSS